MQDASLARIPSHAAPLIFPILGSASARGAVAAQRAIGLLPHSCLSSSSRCLVDDAINLLAAFVVRFANRADVFEIVIKGLS